MLGSLLNVLLAAFAVGLLILVHELGHFLACKAMGVRVEIFSVGYWKKLVGFRKGDTEYRLSLIPFGGYIRMAGEVAGEGTGAPGEFNSKSPAQRAFVLVAGVGMNAVLGLLGFIIAFTIGVPFIVAEVGMLEKGWPAWVTGLREGDVIENIDGTSDPDFQDVQRKVALGGKEQISLVVRRDGQDLGFVLEPRYDPMAGIRRLGFMPPMRPLVTGFFEVEPDGDRCPAREAGMQLGDRVVSVNGKPVSCAREVAKEVRRHPEEAISVVIERKGGRRSLEVIPETVPNYWVGISCVSAQVESVRADGMAARMELRAGDRIAKANGTPLRSIPELEQLIQHRYGDVRFDLDRAGRSVPLHGHIGTEQALRDLMFSFQCTSTNVLTWVGEGSPAWKAGLRPGDTITEVAGEKVETWEEIGLANASERQDPRLIVWLRDGEVHTAEITPERSPEEPAGSMGCIFDRPKQRLRRYGVGGAVTTGVQKTYGTVGDTLLTIRGFFRREVSPRNLGGVVLIAYSAYRAAQQGIGKLLYLTALISIALAFVNILPIPVLDGGHLLFVGIEKLRGRPVGEKIRVASQIVGLSLLILLLAYVVRNDILRLVSLG